jgi:hypothetical protein
MTLVGRILSLVVTSISFLFFLIIKLCYSTALFATVAEVHRRVQVFRQSRRPTLRAIILVPVVILFVSLVLLLLWLWPVLTSGIGWPRPNLRDSNWVVPGLKAIGWLALRLGILAVGGLIGAGIGLVVGRKIPMGRDRFGGVVLQNRGRYLMFWAGTFSVCGMFRLMPWGFVTFPIVWMLVLAACVVAFVHLTLHGRFRALRAMTPAGLPPGRRLELALDAEEAVALSALVRCGPAKVDAVAELLVAGDVAWSSHPVWAGLAAEIGADPARLQRILTRLSSRRLVEVSGGTFAPVGDALRLAALVVADRSVAVSTRTAQGARTRVVTLHGPSAVLWEPGPNELRLREVERSDLAGALLS